MPLTTFTGTSEMTEVIETELLDGAIADFEYEPLSALVVAGKVAGKGNIPKRFARWNTLSIPGAALGIAETVDAPYANVDITESSITPAMIRFLMAISDEVKVSALGGIPAGALAQGLEALNQQMNDDLCNVSTGATSTTGAYTTSFDLSAFRTMRQAYRAMELQKFGVAALVLHDDALDPLETAIDQSASMWALKQSDSLSRELGADYQGRLRGFEVFRDPSVVAASGGRSNFATPMGLGGGLTLVINEMPSVRYTRGDTAENRASDFYHFRCWKGQGISNPRRFLEVRSA